MADVLHTLSIVFLILSGSLAVASLVLWRVFKIPKVIGDLSGSNARKSIAYLRSENEKKAIKKNFGNIKIGKGAETGLLNDNVASEYESEATELLVSDERIETSDLTGVTAPMTGQVIVAEKRVPKITIKLIKDELIVHTDEEI